MGRKPREFTPKQISDMIALFNGGETTDGIGVVYGCSGGVIARILKIHLGDLRTARAMAKARGSMAAEDLEYRDGFTAGYRAALTHANLHGAEQAREHWNRYLLPWRETGFDDIPPVFLRSP